MSISITHDERAQYERDGYLVLRGVFPDEELRRLDEAVKGHLPNSAYAPGKVYPEPAKYTLSEQCPADPNLAYIAEHPRMVTAAEELLGGPGHLTAYVVYIRTPGDAGSSMHNDYKRWRPVGSSMNWLFTILPLTDFDAQTGPLLVAPGSHQLHLVEDRGEKTLHRGAPTRPAEVQFVDAQLRRGDLLLMSMYTWHWAPPNASGTNRTGIFNKYAAANAPPATGYFKHGTSVREAFSAPGRRLIPLADDRPLRTTRLLFTRGGPGEEQLLLVPDGSGGWSPPGGDGWEEDVIPGWDLGSRIGSLTSHLRQQTGFALPWASYIGDFEEGDGLCRVYGFTEDDAKLDLAGMSRTCRWEATSKIVDGSISTPYVPTALEQWRRTDLIRGKGISQAQGKQDQYAV